MHCPNEKEYDSVEFCSFSVIDGEVKDEIEPTLITASQAQERGRRDYRKGKSLDQNPYIALPRVHGAVRLMAWWETGYLKEKKEMEVQ